MTNHKVNEMSSSKGNILITMAEMSYYVGSGVFCYSRHAFPRNKTKIKTLLKSQPQYTY